MYFCTIPFPVELFNAADGGLVVTAKVLDITSDANT